MLSLSGNNLSGQVPSQLLEGLTALQFLELYDNTLTNTIPTTISCLQSIQGIYLAGNSLSQTLPSELFQLTGLQALGLNDNYLEGSISTGIADLISMAELQLDENFLSSSIPEQVSEMTLLNELWLQNNALTGPAGSFLCIPSLNPKNLNGEGLKIYGNQFSCIASCISSYYMDDVFNDDIVSVTSDCGSLPNTPSSSNLGSPSEGDTIAIVVGSIVFALLVGSFVYYYFVYTKQKVANETSSPDDFSKKSKNGDNLELSSSTSPVHTTGNNNNDL
jgi:hypothetical protein